MNAVWELKLFGHDRAGHMRRRTYTFVVEEAGQGYASASLEAQRLARLDGISDPCVWAATRLREVPAPERG